MSSDKKNAPAQEAAYHRGMAKLCLRTGWPILARYHLFEAWRLTGDYVELRAA